MDPVTIFNQSPIKATFVCHIMLMTWALIALDWMPQAFFFYNLMFFLSLFWSLGSPHNSEPVQLAAIINLLSILLDLMCIATNYSRFSYRPWFGFSLFLLICNLILRAVTSIVLLRVYNERNDRFGSVSSDTRPFIGPNSGGNSGGGYQSNVHGYENLDSQTTGVTITPSMGSANDHTKLSSNNATPYQSVPSPYLMSNDNTEP